MSKSPRTSLRKNFHFFITHTHISYYMKHYWQNPCRFWKYDLNCSIMLYPKGYIKSSANILFYCLTLWDFPLRHDFITTALNCYLFMSLVCVCASLCFSCESSLNILCCFLLQVEAAEGPGQRHQWAHRSRRPQPTFSQRGPVRPETLQPEQGSNISHLQIYQHDH